MSARWIRAWAVAVAAAAGVAACGSGGGGGGGGPTLRTGVFVDSPVANIGYRIGTREDVTNAAGEFRYLPGDQITFFIGALEFPSAPAAPVVTPLTLAGTNDVANQAVVNMGRLLLSLDEDGDAADGIQIPENASSIATAVDFDVPPAEFAASTAVTDLVSDSGSVTTTLKSADEAISHLTRSVGIVATWYTPGPELSVLSLFADGQFVFAETGGELPNGLEAGTYDFDGGNETITFVRTFTSGTSGGIGAGTQTGAAIIDGDRLTLWSPGEDPAVDEGLTLVRQPRGTGIVGTWAILDGEYPLGAVLHMFENGRFVFSEASGLPENGVEAGTYVYDAVTEELSVTRTFASGTDGGVGPGTNSFAAVVQGDELTFPDIDPDGAATIFVLFRQ
jgi:hypothetical protein